jgi:hypothetical protein
VAENQNLSGRSAIAEPKFRAHVIPALLLSQDANPRSAAPPFALDHSAETIHGGLVVARRFTTREPPEQPDDFSFAPSQFAQQSLRKYGLPGGFRLRLQDVEPMHNLAILQGRPDHPYRWTRTR